MTATAVAQGGHAARLVVWLASAWLVSACAGLGTPPPGQTERTAAESPPPAQKSVQAVAAFEARQRGAALTAEQQGRWSEAAWAWESLHALRPADETVSARLRQAKNTADSRATLLTQQARLAFQLDDLDESRDLFIRALMAQPTHADAMEGLRSLEVERFKRQWIAPDAARINVTGTGQTRTQTEFADMLTAQGAHAEAAELLLPLASGRSPDAAVRRQLSDVLLALAESQHARNRNEALATLRRSLQADPRNQRALALQRDWRQPSEPAAPR